MMTLEKWYNQFAHDLWWLAWTGQGHLQHTYTGRVLAAFWELAAQLWYFAALGALISTLVWRYVPKERVQRILQGWRHGSIALAALVGLVSPMCTFAAVPLVGRLMGAGVPAAPLMAFLVASPLMNPALFVYTAGVIGMEMALARALAALSLGIGAGYAALWALGRGLMDFSGPAEKAVEPLYPAVAGGVDPSPAQEVRLLLRRLGEELAFIGKFFALGIFIAALARVLLSEELVRSAVGVGSGWAVPVAVALGVPLYACGGGTLPIVETMMQMGMTPGAALAFFIAGPATKFSTLAMLGAVLGRRVLVFYLTLMLGGALLWGYAYPFAGDRLQAREKATYQEMTSEW
jgi:uncharacterized membrane protein YraQ (UPF0718 family)